MAKKRTTSGQTNNLRERAEDKISRDVPNMTHSLSADEMQRNLHELQVNRVELEMQNEELRAAEASQATYFELYDLAPVGYLTLSEKGLILRSNLTAANLLGVARNELINQPLDRFVIRDDQDVLYLHLRQLVATGTACVCELRMEKRNGDPFWARLEASVAQDAEGASRCRVVMSDISESKRMEAALRESEAKYRLLAESVSDVIWAMNFSGAFTFASPSIYALLGYSPEELEHGRMEEVIAPTSLDKARGKLAQFVMEAQQGLEHNSVVQELELVRKDRTTVWTEVTARLMVDDDGTPRGIIGVARNITNRKRAEDALRESEQRFRQVAESAGEWIWEVDAQGIYRYASPVVEKILGYTPEELVGKVYFYDLFAPDVRNQLKEGALNAFAQHLPVNGFVNPNVHKDGHTVILVTNGVPIVDEKGTLLGYRGADLDITQRQCVEAELQRSEAKYRNLHESLRDAFAFVDISGRVRECNREFRDLVGYTDEEIGQLTYMDLTPAKWHEFEASIVRDQIIPKGASEVYEKEYRRKDGSIVPIELRTYLVEGDDSRPTGMWAIIRNISERKLVDAQLRFQGEILTNMREAVVVNDTDMRITWWNHSAERLYGYSAKEVLGKTTTEILQTEYLSGRTREDALRAVQRDGTYNAEVMVRRKDGTRVYVEATTSILRNDLGEIVGFVGVQRDITERKQAEMERRTSEERYRTLFENMLEGFAHCKVIFDEQGCPLDWHYLSVNSAFSRLTGLENVVGKRASVAIPGIHETDPTILKRYARVALTGQPERYESFVEAMNMWFSISVYSPAREQFVAVFDVITERKLAEKRISESQRMLQAVIDGLPGIVFWKDRQSVFLGANNAFLETSGLSARANLIGKTDYDLIWTKEQAESYRADDSRIMDSGRAEVHIIETQQMVDGSTIWVDTSKVPLRDSEGNVIGILGLCFDITDRKRAEEAAKEAYNQLDATLRAIPDLMFEVDLDGRIHSFHGPEHELYVSPQTFLGKRIHDVLPEGASSVIFQALAECVRDGWHRGGIYALNFPDGEHWYELSVARKSESPTDGCHFVILARDVTERMRTESLLVSSQTHLSNAIRIAKLGYWDYDFVNDVFTFNDDFYALFRTTAEQAGGYTMPAARYAELFVHPDDIPMVGEEIRKSVESTDPNYRAQLEHRIIYADGTPGHIAVRFQIVKDQEGRTIRSFGMNQDITERKAAEEKRKSLEDQLRQAQKLETIGTLAGGIAHDFNNILVPILIYSDIAIRSLEEGHPVREDLMEVVDSANRAKNLVKQILTFSRQGEQEALPIDPTPIVKEAMKLMRASIPTTIEFSLNVDSNCGTVLADPSQVHQVLMNLCTNAYHAMRDAGGVLTVALKPCVVDESQSRTTSELTAGDYVCLSVSDTGCGMGQATIERIFEPFFTTKPVGEGTGLGLSVVHGIVVKHGGAITVKSVPGKGSTFDVYFPRIYSTSSGQMTVETPVLGGQERVLVVDDEPSVAATTRKVLERLGYAVTMCTDSLEALELFRQDPQHFDLVLTDQTMPQLTGDHLAEQMIAIRPELPIVLLTGFSYSIDEKRCKELGIRRLLMKPLLPRELAAAVRDVLDGVAVLS